MYITGLYLWYLCKLCENTRSLQSLDSLQSISWTLKVHKAIAWREG